MFGMELNYLAIVVSAVAGMVIGGLWYSPLLFGKAWMKLVEMPKEGFGDPKKAYVISTLLSLVQATAIAVAIHWAGATTLAAGAHVGLVVGLGFVATTMGMGALFSGTPFKLYLINAGQPVVTYIAMGVIIAAWR
ncbi:MAG: DUF1761 domain-containing protein [Sphingomonadales bacterium]